jgi:hypothetical protein
MVLANFCTQFAFNLTKFGPEFPEKISKNAKPLKISRLALCGRICRVASDNENLDIFQKTQ